jgi:hypothetical protein
LLARLIEVVGAEIARPHREDLRSGALLVGFDQQSAVSISGSISAGTEVASRSQPVR